MNNTQTFRQQLRLHNRDIDLMGRLFTEWTRGRSQITAEAESRLDAIEAQLARLERTVRMNRRRTQSATICLAAHRI